MPNTEKSSAEHRSVLENEKNKYGRVSRNQKTALTITRTQKTPEVSQNNGKQEYMEKLNKNDKNRRKNEVL